MLYERQSTESTYVLDSFEKILRIAALIPQAICAIVVVVVIMSYMFKAYILSDRNNDSYWWHFGELRFYAWDIDWWNGFVISMAIVLGIVALLAVCWIINIYCAYTISERNRKLELERLRASSSMSREHLIPTVDVRKVVQIE